MKRGEDMSVVRENFRVVCFVDEFTTFANHDEKTRIIERRAKQIRDDIKRHIDGIASHQIEWDTVCEFCGATWETDPDTKEPVCCGRAQEQFSTQPNK
mgnify:CR=1 FL=1